MPDNQDYESLRELLATPENWSKKRAFDLLHPKDVKGRRWAQVLIDQLEDAIRRRELA